MYQDGSCYWDGTRYLAGRMLHGSHTRGPLMTTCYHGPPGLPGGLQPILGREAPGLLRAAVLGAEALAGHLARRRRLRGLPVTSSEGLPQRGGVAGGLPMAQLQVLSIGLP